MRPFTRSETIGTSLILLIIVLLTLSNLRVSLRRARDSQRKADINAIVDALDKYQKDFGFFPPSTEDGKIKACKSDDFGPIPESVPEGDRKSYFLSMLRGCDWGKDGLKDINDDSYPPYLAIIPSDPKAGQGYSYLYISDMDRFQLFAYLEGRKSEVGFRQGIVDRNLNCGINICNYGKAYGDTPLEKSIQEYENELRSKGD